MSTGKKIFKCAIALMLLLCMIPNVVYAQNNIDAYFEDGYEGSSNYYRIEPRTKKGLQEAMEYSGVYKDLGISHTLINVCLNQLLNGSVPHTYNGKTYYFDYIPELSVEEVAKFNKNNVCVTVVLLMQMDYRSTQHNLIYPGALGNTGKLYYAWNVNDAAAKQTLCALMDFLAMHYGRENAHIDNWVVGNEVNMPNAWNYTGTTNVATNVDVAAKSFVIVNDAIKRYNTGAKAYLSLDHSWTHNDEGRGIGGKTFLDGFAARIEELQPGIDWNLAYHPYSPIMTDSNIWNSRNALKYTPDSIYADFISAKNLTVLTEYVRDNFGEDVRIILSEQGFTSYNGQHVSQAASLAYTYYAAEFNDMIDATMFRSLKDAAAEIVDNFYFGLLNSDGSKRMAYDVFKYMDTEEWAFYTNGCLKHMGIGHWNEFVTYFDGERFTPKPLEEIVIEKDGIVMTVGYKEKIAYETYPQFAKTAGLKWISDDESIVKVDANSGELMAVAPGRTVVMAVIDKEEFATCIVVVKDKEESSVNIGNFVNEVYLEATGQEATEVNKNSYVERLMSKNITGSQVVYEIIAGKEATNPSATTEEYVRMVYRAVLGYNDEEVPADMVEKYVVAIDNGMNKYTIIADLISKTEFDYRCYDSDVDTGKFTEIGALKNLYMTSTNRNVEMTYFISNSINVMLGRKPGNSELSGLCTKMLANKVTKVDVLKAIVETEDFINQEISDEAFVEMIYSLSTVDEPNEYIKTMWINMLETEHISKTEIIEGFAEYYK